MTMQSFYVHFRLPLEFRGLSGYCICVIWILCSTLALIHIKMFNEPKIIAKNGILVYLSFVGISFFLTIVDISWFQGRAYYLVIHKLF
jgi:hypothetical protein